MRGKPRIGAVVRVVVAAAVVAAVTVGCSRFAGRNVAPGPVMTPDGVKFRFYSPGASRVQIAGNWPENNWAKGDGSVGEANIGLMKVDKNGIWETVVPLGPGRFQYRFWVDENTWHVDPGNPEEVDSGPRGRVSVLVIYLQGGKLEIH
jgi:hypothetical protein